MNLHEQFGDDLALYALGALQGEERDALEKHLESCADCRGELEQLRADGSLLALSTMGPKPPQRSRERLMKAVAKEPKFKAAPQKRAWWGVAGWVLAAAMVVVAFGLWSENENARRDIAGMTQAADEQAAKLQEASEVVNTLTATDAMHFTLVRAKEPPQPQGRAIYVRNRSSLVFVANNMPKLPPQKAYELWLIPTKGAPIAAGVFKPDSHGSATVINPPLPAGTEAKTFAITVESEAGSPVPTSPVVMLGVGE